MPHETDTPAAPRRRRHLAHGLALALWLGTFASPPDARAATDAAQPSLFGSTEIRASGVAMFPKWQGVVSRHFDQSRLPDGPCESGLFNRCHLKEWKEFLDSIRGLGRGRQIEAVNEFMNRKRYIIDPRNYGMPDYWATPRQFLDRDGDCEDYAIAKYMSLRDLGVDPAAMRIVVLQDMNLKVAHAILVVWLDGKPLVLDNQIRSVVEAGVVRHYRPIYSINEQYWWLHRL